MNKIIREMFYRGYNMVLNYDGRYTVRFDRMNRDDCEPMLNSSKNKDMEVAIREAASKIKPETMEEIVDRMRNNDYHLTITSCSAGQYKAEFLCSGCPIEYTATAYTIDSAIRKAAKVCS